MYISCLRFGLYAPHWQENARGVIVGLTAMPRAHIARAALEATAYQTRSTEAMEQDSGSRITELRVDGGMVQRTADAVPGRHARCAGSQRPHYRNHGVRCCLRGGPTGLWRSPMEIPQGQGPLVSGHDAARRAQLYARWSGHCSDPWAGSIGGRFGITLSGSGQHDLQNNTGQMSFKTRLASLASYDKGTIELNDDLKHYAFSNIFEVCSKSKPYERVMAQPNTRPRPCAPKALTWYTAPHDEFATVMDGEMSLLSNSPTPRSQHTRPVRRDSRPTPRASAWGAWSRVAAIRCCCQRAPPTS
jgi:hypothetical protein